MTERAQYDVVVVGTGSAGLIAALSARDAGAKVLVLEKSPQELRGGDTYFAGGGFRFPYNGVREIQELIPDLSETEATSLAIGTYTPDDYYNDFMYVTQGLADPELAEVVARESTPTVRWMGRQGVKWELFTTISIRAGNRLWWPPGSVPVGARGGGAGLSDTLFRIIQQRGAGIVYETKAIRLLVNSKGRVSGVTVQDKEGFADIKSKAVILACGGFQANREMRARYLGSPWDVVKIRGTRFNTGDGLKMAFEIGALPAGHWTGCHATTIDANAPDIPDRAQVDESARRCFHLGITVNTQGKRFKDEGEDYNILTYSKWGAAILSQPQRIAFQLFDSSVRPLLDSHYVHGACITANSIEELAEKLGTDREVLVETIKEFNNSVTTAVFDPTKKDGKHTVGISPGKSNWACPLGSPPFLAYPVTGGITFTYGGLKINEEARVLNTEEQVIPGLYAAGEIVGGLCYGNYVGGSALSAAVVFGRIAGANAAAD